MKISNQYLLSGILIAASLLSGCSSKSGESEPASANGESHSERSDPLEGFNRTMFNFNYNVVDAYVVRPVAVGWRNHVPKPVRTGLSNFSNNLGEPVNVVNRLVQGEPRRAAIHFNRFVVNTFLGLGGFIDIASLSHEDMRREDTRRFGSVLGYYGVGYGTYVVIPAYGSATPREDVGGLVDGTYPIFSYLVGWPIAVKWVFDGIETRAQFLDQDQMLSDSADPYVFMREAYFQNRDFLANNGAIVTGTNPNASAIADDLDEIDSL